jgi:hypothetical protein
MFRSSPQRIEERRRSQAEKNVCNYYKRLQPPNLYICAHVDLADLPNVEKDPLAFERALLQQTRITEAYITFRPTAPLERWIGEPVGRLADESDWEVVGRELRRVLETRMPSTFPVHLDPREARLVNRHKRSSCIAELKLKANRDFEVRAWHQVEFRAPSKFSPIVKAVIGGALSFCTLLALHSEPAHALTAAIFVVVAVLSSNRQHLIGHAALDTTYEQPRMSA